MQGTWFYKVVHANGMRFAKSDDLANASDRHEKVHPEGAIIKATEKKVEAGSMVAKILLANNCGWIFENSRTGEVLDRLGDQAVVLPTLPEQRVLREFWAVVTNTFGCRVHPFPLAPTEVIFVI